MASAQPLLLLAIDLEEFYGADGRPASTATPLPELVGPLLDLLRRHGARTTFFTVGDVARDHPELLCRVAAAGHEVACHGDRHRPLPHFDAAGLARDLARNRQAIEALGLPAPQGFRAPLLSLGPAQAWAHRVLREAGFTYSSSVYPARSALYGWPGFGAAPRRVEGVWELPASLGRLGPWRFPCLGGAYFRLLPDPLARRLIARAARRGPVVGYVHPYDGDARQPWTWHAELVGRRLLNHLLFVRRGSLLPRLDRLLAAGWRVRPYAERVAALAAAAEVTDRRAGS